MEIIAVVNQKGGVAKTTSTQNIGAGLTKLGKKVLLIDLDPQGNLSQGFGINTYKLDYTIYELIRDEVFPANDKITIEDVIIEKEGISILPSNMNLANIQMELTGVVDGVYMLQALLDRVKGYDYVFIDCPPSLDILTQNALVAAKSLYVPVEPEYYALQGIRQLMVSVNRIKRRINPELSIKGVIATKFDSRVNLHKEVVEQLSSHFTKEVFKTVIRKNISLAEAPSSGTNIFNYDSNSNGANDYMKLCKEIIQRES